MNVAIKEVIKNLEKELDLNISSSNWHLKQFKEYEQKVLDLKETINELKQSLTKCKRCGVRHHS